MSIDLSSAMINDGAIAKWNGALNSIEVILTNEKSTSHKETILDLKRQCNGINTFFLSSEGTIVVQVSDLRSWNIGQIAQLIYQHLTDNGCDIAYNPEDFK